MYTLHIGNKNYSSWSLRPWVLARALNIPFEEVMHFFTPGSNFEAFSEFNPAGLVPCLVAGEETVWDSLAIAEYLAERHEGVWPQANAARTWARCAAAEMHSGFSTLRNLCPMNCGLRVKLHEISAELQHDYQRIDQLWQEGLRRFGGPFLAGEKFSAVDAFYAPVVFRFQTYGFDLSDAATAYINHMVSLEAMVEWYEQALAEPQREEIHEQEAFDTGTILQDFRSQ